LPFVGSHFNVNDEYDEFDEHDCHDIVGSFKNIVATNHEIGSIST
jgi:hypothetical protein